MTVVTTWKNLGSMVAVLALLATTLAMIVGGAAPASAAVINVTCPGDSLQTAITGASAGDTINVTGTCSEAIDINQNLTIVGSGAASAIIDATGKADSVIDITGGTAIEISGVTIRGGSISEGGGVNVFPNPVTVTLTNSVVTSNTATSNGGAFWIRGTLNLVNTSVTNNVGGSGIGGAIYVSSGGGPHTVNLTDSTISGNSVNSNGGGIAIQSASTLNVTRSTFSNNKADADLAGGGDGGSIHNTPGGTVTITNSTIGKTGNPNTAANGGGIYNTGGTVTITGSTVGPNTATSNGGGIYTINGTTTVNTSTISGNQATFLGGGVYSHGATGTLGLTNSTISGNSAGSGAGLYNTVSATVTAANATIGANTGTSSGGGYRNFATLTLKATIVAGNNAPAGPDCDSAAGSLGYNLIGNGSGCTFVPGPTDQVNVDAKLAPVAANGSTGPFTHALLQGSAAINKIPPGSCAVTTDERGVARPQGANCDIGAFEAQPATAVNDSYSVPQLGTLTQPAKGVLTNDTDPEGDTLTATKVTDPGKGALTLNADGSFTYTPNGNFVGNDSFTYRANDATGTSNVATVTITVTGGEVHTVGLVDPGSGKWYLYDSAGVQKASFFYGNPGDYPIYGDWDGDGVETPGLYRQSDGYVYLRNSNTQGIADIKFFFGNPGDVPIAGDFNNDGFDTVSIYRPSNQTFYIINKLGSGDQGLGAADFSYVFGNPGDKPFVGDFDGDGVETAGLHRESTGLVYFRNSHTQGNADAQFIFGDPGDRLVAGDWTADGTFTPALFRPSNTTMYFRYTNTQGNADNQWVGGQATWLPVSGNNGLG